MNKKRSKESHSIYELRRMLVERHHLERRNRLEHFRHTGQLFNHRHSNHFPPKGDRPSGLIPVKPVIKNRVSRSIHRNKVLNNVLLSIEILAVFGLLFIVYSGIIMLRDFNQEIVKAMNQPTYTVTPSTFVVILPSDHTPPNPLGGVRPNEVEISENLRSAIELQTTLPIPTQAPQHATRIQIPTIGVDAPIVQGDGWEQLKQGVGQHIGSANPGEDNNMVLSAHNDVYGEIFRHLDRLIPGDEVIIHTQELSFTYLVSETQIVDSTHIEVLASTNQPMLTLISCYPYLINNKRIVVTANLSIENH